MDLIFAVAGRHRHGGQLSGLVPIRVREETGPRRCDGGPTFLRELVR